MSLSEMTQSWSAKSPALWLTLSQWSVGRMTSILGSADASTDYIFWVSRCRLQSTFSEHRVEGRVFATDFEFPQDFGRQGDRQNRVDRDQRVYGTFHFYNNPLSSIPAKKEGQSPRAENKSSSSSVCPNSLVRSLPVLLYCKEWCITYILSFRSYVEFVERRQTG